MGAIHAFQAMPNFADRLARINEQIAALNLHRKASATVRVLTAPIVDRVQAEAQAVERIERLRNLPLPTFTDTEE